MEAVFRAVHHGASGKHGPAPAVRYTGKPSARPCDWGVLREGSLPKEDTQGQRPRGQGRSLDSRREETPAANAGTAKAPGVSGGAERRSVHTGHSGRASRVSGFAIVGETTASMSLHRRRTGRTRTSERAIGGEVSCGSSAQPSARRQAQSNQSACANVAAVTAPPLARFTPAGRKPKRGSDLGDPCLLIPHDGNRPKPCTHRSVAARLNRDRPSPSSGNTTRVHTHLRR